jgi:two-component system NtrC family sensor kinase
MSGSPGESPLSMPPRYGNAVPGRRAPAIGEPAAPGMKWYKSIEFKIIVSVAIITIVINCFIAYLYLSFQSRHLDETILRSASQLSETIKKSIKYDMLENRKEHAYRIMETIGQQQGIEKVRIYNSEGKIVFSTFKKEQGSMVDKKAEACYACHSEEEPLEKLETSARNRFFPSEFGYRVLGMINPMYNEADCSAKECHFHPEAQKVLGVIDVTMSLADVDKDITTARSQVILFNILSILTLSAILVYALMTFVGRPVKELVLGTKKVAEGDLKYIIPITSEDEMGELAHSFNQMTEKLSKANEEILDWVRTLENKVEMRTRELKETQFQLLHTEKLAALGKIAATVAHEINNPLSGVFTYIKLMERKIEEGKDYSRDIGKFREYLSTMSREVQRTSAIVHNLLDLTRPKEPSRILIDLNSLLEESIQIVQNKIKLHDIRVDKRLSPLPGAMADLSQIKQVFINLIINACEAMENGGTLTITSCHNEADQTQTFSFTDTGDGIPEEHLSNIFDPFFTTKEKGTGLGLSVVYGIVTRHNGKIEVNSVIGKGTEITIVLPTDR